MWMHDHSMWGFWWIFPLLGVTFFVVFIALLVKAFSGGAFSGSRNEVEELRKEILNLKEEIETLKKQGN